MARSSSGPSHSGAKRGVLVVVATAAVVGCVLAAVYATTPLVDSGRGPAAADAPVGSAPCKTVVHGVVFGESSLIAGFVPATYRLTSGNPADFGARTVTYSLERSRSDPPRVGISLIHFTGKLNRGVGGMSVPTKIRVQGRPALLENGASRGQPFIGIYWKHDASHLLSVVGYKMQQSTVLRVAAHVHARLGAVMPLPLNPGRIVSRGVAVSEARGSVPFHPGSTRAKLSSWTEVLSLVPEKFRVPAGFGPTPWHPIWVVMVAHRDHQPQMVLINAHSRGVAFSATVGHRSGWFEALTDRDPNLDRGCPGGSSARLPFGIMTRTEEAYALRDSGGSSLVGRIRVTNTVIMKLTTISAIHRLGCTKQDCGPYDLLWPRIEVTRAAPGKTLPCPPPWAMGPGGNPGKPTKEYFSISAGNISEEGCGPLPGWVSRVKDLAPAPRT
jgi:hypothetical protein